jgi:hypothetical protein
MTVVMLMDWEGLTPQQYDAAWRAVDWEADRPAGALSHIAWFSGTGLSVAEAWESVEHFERFLAARLLPETRRCGVCSEPITEIYPAHRVVALTREPASLS